MSRTPVDASPALRMLMGHVSPPGLEHLAPKSPTISTPSTGVSVPSPKRRLGMPARTGSLTLPATPCAHHLGLVTLSPTLAAAALPPCDMANVLSLLPLEVKASHAAVVPASQECTSSEHASGKSKTAQECLDSNLLHCCLCDAVEDHVDRFFVDGRFVCDNCRRSFDPSDFLSEHQVCLNPFCRRKWKQLTPKVLPPFCPPCKTHLEESIASQDQCTNGALIEKMYQRWHAISAELAVEFGCAEPPPLVLDESECTAVHCGEAGDAKRPSRWRMALEAFKESFLTAPCPEEVRNWNSVHSKRKHYRGVVHRGHQVFMCTVEALEELQEDGFTTLKQLAPGSREYTFLDWSGNLKEGEEVIFIAFPNPALSERESVSRIVRILDRQGESVARMDSNTGMQALERSSGSFVGGDVINTTSVFDRAREEVSTCPAVVADTFADSFSDLMQWSTGEGAMVAQTIETPTVASDVHNMHLMQRAKPERLADGVTLGLSLTSMPAVNSEDTVASTLPLKLFCGGSQHKVAHRLAVANPFVGQKPGSAGQRLPPQNSLMSTMSRACVPSASPSSQVTHRSPGLRPRSPVASYFDD